MESKKVDYLISQYYDGYLLGGFVFRYDICRRWINNDYVLKIYMKYEDKAKIDSEFKISRKVCGIKAFMAISNW